jgi:hypothetical protein
MKIATAPVVSAAIIVAGLLLGFVYLAIFPIFSIILLWCFLGGLLFALYSKRAGWVVYNVAFVFLALAITELHFEFNKIDGRAAYPHLMQSQDSLGYVGRPGIFRAVKTYGFGTVVIYDVHYSMPNGLRMATECMKQNGPTVMFFGDSFTFGEGVNDEDTLPNAFSIVSGMCALNFGLSGYGPHHMLRLLELDVPKKITLSSPRLMVYIVTGSHIARAAGHATWDRTGPMYEIQNGRAQYVGSFSEHNLTSDPPAIRSSIIEKLLRHSYIWRTYAGHRDYHRPAPDDHDTLTRDRARFLEIIKTADVFARQNYQSRLVVMLWDVGTWDGLTKQNVTWIEAKLLENNIPTLRLSSAIGEAHTMKETDFRTWIMKNWIIRKDGHPNPRAYREAAKILSSWLMHNPTIGPSLSH